MARHHIWKILSLENAILDNFTSPLHCDKESTCDNRYHVFVLSTRDWLKIASLLAITHEVSTCSTTLSTPLRVCCPSFTGLSYRHHLYQPKAKVRCWQNSDTPNTKQLGLYDLLGEVVGPRSASLLLLVTKQNVPYQIALDPEWDHDDQQSGVNPRFPGRHLMQTQYCPVMIRPKAA